MIQYFGLFWVCNLESRETKAKNKQMGCQTETSLYGGPKSCSAQALFQALCSEINSASEFWQCSGAIQGARYQTLVGQVQGTPSLHIELWIQHLQIETFRK